MMKAFVRLVSATAFVWLALSRGSYGECAEPARRDVPSAVITFFEQLRMIGGSNAWTYRIGSSFGACNAGWGANKRCLLIDGRRLGDAVSFTACVGWHERTRQVLAVIYFEDGDSLVIRGGGDPLSATPWSSLEGDVSGSLRGVPVDFRFVAARKGELWTIECRLADGTVKHGVLGSPRTQP